MNDQATGSAFQHGVASGDPLADRVVICSHGYNLIDVTPDRVVAEWWAVDTVLRRTSAERRVATWSVANGVPRVVRGDGR